MNLDGAQLASAMLSVHEAEMQQAARYPGQLLSDRVERRVVLHQHRNRALCRLGSLLIRAGLRLQQYGMPQPPPLSSNAIQR